MIVRAKDAGDKQVYINTNQIITIYQVSDDTYNVYLIEEKSAQIDGATLRQITREA